MTTEQPFEPVSEVVFTPEFKRNIKALKKRYPHLRDDVDPVIQSLEKGEFPGTQIPRVRYPVYKVRLENSDIQKGKSAGYRFIYYIHTPAQIWLLSLYSKSDRANISAKEINSIIQEFSESLSR